MERGLRRRRKPRGEVIVVAAQQFKKEKSTGNLTHTDKVPGACHQT